MAPPTSRPNPGAGVPAWALVPLRAFLGGTFVYAGLDKLVDPRFLDPASPASIVAQLHAFERFSPLAPLIQLAEPYATLIGLLIALAEIAIGLGTLSGLLFRAAALGGASISILFWLTASWATHPFYYGPDLPYAAGWLALALAGHGDLLVPRQLLRRRPAVPRRERRALLQAFVLAIGAIAVAALAAPLRLVGGTANPDHPGAPGEPGPAPLPGSPAPGSGIAIARVEEVERAGSFAFTIPFTAPAPLPAGDPGIIVRLTDGTFVAYDATCTHEACTVAWDVADGLLVCPCHGAMFDAADRARVVSGPTDQPLTALPIVVDAGSGTIALRV